jgi:hypothetical protein
MTVIVLSHRVQSLSWGRALSSDRQWMKATRVERQSPRVSEIRWVLARDGEQFRRQWFASVLRVRSAKRSGKVALLVGQIGTGTIRPISEEVVPSQHWVVCGDLAIALLRKLPNEETPLYQEIVSRLAGKEIQVFPPGKVFPPGITPMRGRSAAADC